MTRSGKRSRPSERSLGQMKTDPSDERQQRDKSTDDKRDECCEGRLIWRTELGRQAVFLREHRAHPAVLIGSYQLNRLLQLFSFKALFSIDLADLIAFALRRNSNVWRYSTRSNRLRPSSSA